MYTDFTLKNFRVFDEEGINIPLRPITILTGCNNSGKSSITKALCLLKDFCRQIEEDFEDEKELHLERYKMDFLKKPNDILGNFDLVIHHQNKQQETKAKDNREENASEEKHVTFEIVVDSSWFLQDVILHLEFASLDQDELKNGYLNSYSIKTLDGKEIYKVSKDGKASSDFSVVKKSMLHFLYGQHAFSEWQSRVDYCSATGEYLSDEDDEAKLFDKYFRLISDNLGWVSLILALEWQVSHGLHSWKDGGTGHASSILKKVENLREVEKSFIENSPQMNVYTYFPCFELFKNIEKKKIRKTINDIIEAKCITSLDQKIIDLFLDSFEESEAETLHDFISQKENDAFFTDEKIFAISGNGMIPLPWCGPYRFNAVEDDETDLPEKADWTIIVKALDIINQLMTNTDKSYLDFHEVDHFEFYKYNYYLFKYFRNAIEEIFANIMPGSFTYSPTTIVRPQRLYSLEEDSDFTNTLKKYFEVKRLWISEVEKCNVLENLTIFEDKHQPCSFINKWLCQLGIAHHIDIKTHANGYGVTIHLYDNENDEKGMLLADKGFGVLQLFAFLLKIENAIIESQINEVRYPNCTRGLSENLIKCLRTYNQLHPITIALEEPECHLHPSLQSQFADIIADAYKQHGIHFLIESHSEYFIRRLQLLVSEKEIKNGDVTLLYVNPQNRPSYIPAITDIGIESDGTLKNEFGSGFFDESTRLSKELFKAKQDDNED